MGDCPLLCWIIRGYFIRRMEIWASIYIPNIKHLHQKMDCKNCGISSAKKGISKSRSLRDPGRISDGSPWQPGSQSHSVPVWSTSKCPENLRPGGDHLLWLPARWHHCASWRAGKRVVHQNSVPGPGLCLFSIVKSLSISTAIQTRMRFISNAHPALGSQTRVDPSAARPCLRFISASTNSGSKDRTASQRWRYCLRRTSSSDSLSSNHVLGWSGVC